MRFVVIKDSVSLLLTLKRKSCRLPAKIYFFTVINRTLEKSAKYVQS